MNIDYNKAYALSVELTQVPNKALYQLKMNKIDKVKNVVYDIDIYFFEPHELKQLSEYLNEVTNGII